MHFRATVFPERCKETRPRSWLIFSPSNTFDMNFFKVRDLSKLSATFKPFRSCQHSFISFSKLRHNLFANFSDTFHHRFTNTLAVSPHSVLILSPAAAHTKKFICCIDSNSFSGFSSTPFIRKYQKCSGTLPFKSDCIRIKKSLLQSRKMVWITDLDDPKVLL